jgi:hypothetical protein
MRGRAYSIRTYGRREPDAVKSRRCWSIVSEPPLVNRPVNILRWSRLSEQVFRIDKWSLCRG